MQIEQIFQTVKAHLLKQNSKSKGLTSVNEVACAYRGENGTMCAVGCLIKDEHYAKEMEGTVFQGLYREYSHAFRHLNLTATKIHMLQELQFLHDHHTPEEWPKQLNEVYNKYVAQEK